MGRIEEMRWLGQEAVYLDNGVFACIVVPTWGGQVISLRWLPGDLELLRVPENSGAYEAEPVLYGMPLLFPPNRIEAGRFEFGGRMYQFDITEPERNNHLHGFVHNRPWELVTASSGNGGPSVRLRFRARAFPEVMRQFPHDFVLETVIRLDGEQFKTEVCVRNEGDTPFPWGLGYHTTFRLPLRPGNRPQACWVQLPVQSQWELNERLLPTGRLEDTDLARKLRQGMQVYGVPLDAAFRRYTLEEDGRLTQRTNADMENAAILTDPEEGISVVYACDPLFRHWVIYNAGGCAGFVCPEPYTWITNAPNLPLAREITGVNVLEPGGSAVLHTSIRIDRKGRG